MGEAGDGNNTPRPIGAQFRLVAADQPAGSDAPEALIVAIIEAMPGVSVEAARRDLDEVMALAGFFSELMDELAEVHADRTTTPLERAGVQLGMVVRFLESAGVGHRHDDLRELFRAVLDKVEGGNPPLLFEVPRPPNAKTKPNVRHRDIERGYRAAAADVLLAASMKREEVRAWTGWKNPAAAADALLRRDQIYRKRSAPPLMVAAFNDLRPMPRQPVTRAEAEALALQWLATVDFQRTGPASKT